MDKGYQVLSEFNDAICGITFRTFDDGVDTSVIVDYTVRSYVHETDWKQFGRICESVETWKDELHYLATHVQGNWGIHIINPDGSGNGILFESYGHDGPCIDLGTLAKCYGDCDTCDRYCHSSKDEFPYDCKTDCPRYSQCADVYGTIYDEWGEEEDFDTLWDFRCQCTKVNGRESLKKALIAKEPLYQGFNFSFFISTI